MESDDSNPPQLPAIERCGVTFDVDGLEYWLPKRGRDFIMPTVLDYTGVPDAPTMRQQSEQGDVVDRFFHRNPELGKRMVANSKALIRGALAALTCDDDVQLRLLAARACAGEHAAPVPLPPLAARGELGDFLEREGLTSGAEVGVQAGNNARRLLDRWPRGRRLLLVDPWAPMGATYMDQANFNAPDQAAQDAVYARAMEAVAPHRGRVDVCRNTSAACAPLVPDGSLDFVYLDARHDRPSVAEDLRLWWPKVRAGGVLAGHDYVTADYAYITGQRWDVGPSGEVDAEGLAVQGAVDDFAREVCRQVAVSYDEESAAWWTWLLRK